MNDPSDTITPHPRTQPRVVSGLGETEKPVDHPSQPPPVLKLDPRTYARSQDCVQCGLCLPSCPTYVTTGQEADSPRGRIRLIKGLADGRISPTESVIQHLDLCLDCRACETACPSGVVYHELIEETRTEMKHASQQAAASGLDQLIQAFVLNILPYPHRLRPAVWPVGILQSLGLWGSLMKPPLSRAIPARVLKMMRMLPRGGVCSRRSFETRYPAQPPHNAQHQATVGLFTGCVGGVLFPQVNRQMIAVLQHAGCDVVVPRGQQCCGAIHHHSGSADQARHFARANIDALIPPGKDTPSVDYVVNGVAGCGAMLKEYPHLLRDDPAYAQKAAAFAARVRDITELLVALDPPKPDRTLCPEHRRVTYHDACHLVHAQGIAAPPRDVLSWVPGLEVVPLPESDRCCGAAGSYNLTQPEMAGKLGERKVRCIQETGAKVCVTGNAGCAMQIQCEADRLGVDLKVVHPITLLHEAYFG